MSLITPSTHCRYSTMHLKSSQRFNISSFKGTGLKLCKSETYRAFFFMYAILNFILDYAFFDNKLLFFVQKKVYPIKDTPEYLNLFDYLSYLNNQIS